MNITCVMEKKEQSKNRRIKDKVNRKGRNLKCIDICRCIFFYEYKFTVENKKTKKTFTRHLGT